MPTPRLPPVVPPTSVGRRDRPHVARLLLIYARPTGNGGGTHAQRRRPTVRLPRVHQQRLESKWRILPVLWTHAPPRARSCRAGCPEYSDKPQRVADASQPRRLSRRHGDNQHRSCCSERRGLVTTIPTALASCTERGGISRRRGTFQARQGPKDESRAKPAYR